MTMLLLALLEVKLIYERAGAPEELLDELQSTRPSTLPLLPAQKSLFQILLNQMITPYLNYTLCVELTH